MHVLDLATYEVGNVLLHGLGWSAIQVADQLTDLRSVLGGGLTLSATGLQEAAELGHQYQLTFYDACWAAAAVEFDAALVSADRQLLAAGLAISAPSAVSRLGLS